MKKINKISKGQEESLSTTKKTVFDLEKVLGKFYDTVVSIYNNY